MRLPWHASSVSGSSVSVLAEMALGESREEPPSNCVIVPYINEDMYVYVSGFEKKDHFGLIVDFDLVVLCKSTVDGLSVALCCTSMAAPIPEICSLQV